MASIDGIRNTTGPLVPVDEDLYELHPAGTTPVVTAQSPFVVVLSSAYAECALTHRTRPARRVRTYAPDTPACRAVSAQSAQEARHIA